MAPPHTSTQLSMSGGRRSLESPKFDIRHSAFGIPTFHFSHSFCVLPENTPLPCFPSRTILAFFGGTRTRNYPESHLLMKSSLLRALLLLATLPFCFGELAAQQLVVSSLDASNYPTISAKVYLLDSTGKPLPNMNERAIRVRENGAERRVSSVDCPSPTPVDALSSVLTIDVSGSMANTPDGRAGTPNMELAKAAARAWVEGLPAGASECALTTFDQYGQIIRDFTRDRTDLAAAIASLKPQGGTEYDAGLRNPPAGGLVVAANGKHRRVVIFLTDGLGGGDQKKIIELAQANNAAIFCVTLGMPAPDILKNISRATGGEFYEYVTTVPQAQAVYRAIQYRALGGQPCQVTWQSIPDCDVSRNVILEVPAAGLAATLHYEAPPLSVPRLDLLPPAVEFGAVKVGEVKKKEVELHAVGRDVTVTGITLMTSMSQFQVDAPATPFTIPAGSSRELTIRYTPTDTAYRFARWSITSDACAGAILFASAGNRARPEPSIRLIRPNGGERFVAGSEATIAWDGVAPETAVQLEYSTDAGTTWKTIIEKTSGGSFRWKVPATPSERCLARVAEIDTAATAAADTGMRLTGAGEFILTNAFSPDGTTVAGASWSGVVPVWDVATGKKIRTISVGMNGTRPARAYYVEFSPNGKLALTAAEGNQVSVWDMASGREVAKFKGKPFNKTERWNSASSEGDVTPNPAFSPDGSKLLLMDENYTPTLFDLSSGRKLRAFGAPQNGEIVTSAIFSSDGTRILTAGPDSAVRVWDAASGTQLQKIKHARKTEAATFSPDAQWIASVTTDDTVRIFNAVTGAPVQKIRAGKRYGASYLRALFAPDGESLLIWHGTEVVPTLFNFRTGAKIREMNFDRDGKEFRTRSSIGYANFSPDGQHIVTVDGSVNIWDVATGRRMSSNRWSSQMSFAAFSPDGARIASSEDANLIVRTVGVLRLQEDRSDSLWAILDTDPLSTGVNFGRRRIGSITDRVVPNMIRNAGAVPFLVDSIWITGPNAREFGIVSGIPPFTVAPGENHSMELRFRPSARGLRGANIHIIAGGKELIQALEGEGIREDLAIEMPEIDFGDVPVGSRRDTVIPVMIRNLTTTPLTITSSQFTGPDTTQFSVVDGGGRFTIPPNSGHRMELRFAPIRGGRTSTRLTFRADDSSDVTARLFGSGITTEIEEPETPGIAEEYVDPTTFRTIAAPNAILPKGGDGFVGSYDLLGLIAGYSITDNVMVLAGGGVPLPDDWFGLNGTMYGAYSAGIKAGLPLTQRLNIAGGYQWARSIYDQDVTESLESQITVSIPYLAVSYGDDDSRFTLTGAYASKQHITNGIGGTFDRNALIISGGGDYRVGKRWKIAAEFLSMETLGYLPIMATARWFGHSWALDMGVAVVGITTGESEAPSIPVLPVVSFVKVW